MLLWMIKISLLVYLGFGAFLYLAQRNLMYFPVPERDAVDLPVEYLASDGERLKIWVLNGDSPHAVIYFGGNAEDVYHNAEDFRRTLPGHAVYLVNYRGYGGSSGTPTEEGLLGDALQLYDRLSNRHQTVSAVGRSLGSGVATYLASQRPIHRLVLVTPLDSTLALARRLYPVYPVAWMLKDRYESVKYADRISAPTLFLIADNDRIIPARHSERLAMAFADGLVERAVIENAGHNGLSGYARYWEEIARFLNTASARRD